MLYYCLCERRDHLVMELTGELDFETLSYFQAATQRILNTGVKNLILDFEEVSHMDSMAIGHLNQFALQARQMGVNMALTGFKPVLKIILERLRLMEHFQVFETRREAIESFRAGEDALGEEQNVTA